MPNNLCRHYNRAIEDNLGRTMILLVLLESYHLDSCLFCIYSEPVLMRTKMTYTDSRGQYKPYCFFRSHSLFENQRYTFNNTIGLESNAVNFSL